MKLLFDLKRSLEANSPSYGKGIKWIKRISVKLKDLITTDERGLSLQPRDKEWNEHDIEELATSFRAFGVLYERQVMVVELRPDGKLEVQSGFNRIHVLLYELGVDSYFVDVIEYDNPHMKALWKRRFNASKDHVAQGIPNTQGSFLLGLDEAKAADSFDYTSNKEVLEALEFMANGSKTSDQLDKLLKKWRQTNHPNPKIRGLNSTMTNTLNKDLGLPHKGYCKDMSKPWFGRTGFNVYHGDFGRKIKEYVDLYDKYKAPIELYAFVPYVVADKIREQRQSICDQYKDTVMWMKNHLDVRYHDIVHLKGFHAQIGTSNQKDGGKRLERGIVDVEGNIIIDTPNGN